MNEEEQDILNTASRSLIDNSIRSKDYGDRKLQNKHQSSVQQQQQQDESSKKNGKVLMEERDNRISQLETGVRDIQSYFSCRYSRKQEDMKIPLPPSHPPPPPIQNCQKKRTNYKGSQQNQRRIKVLEEGEQPPIVRRKIKPDPSSQENYEQSASDPITVEDIQRYRQSTYVSEWAARQNSLLKSLRESSTKLHEMFNSLILIIAEQKQQIDLYKLRSIGRPNIRLMSVSHPPTEKWTPFRGRETDDFYAADTSEEEHDAFGSKKSERKKRKKILKKRGKRKTSGKSHRPERPIQKKKKKPRKKSAKKKD